MKSICEMFNCDIAVNDFGVFQCKKCQTHFTKMAVKKTLMNRLGKEWNNEYQKLMRQKTSILRKSAQKDTGCFIKIGH
jgi:hypothetical protein